MNFARKQLEKYGWTDGKGLGRFENGISEALKPKIKRSVTGIGHDAAADFTEHWWTKLYNKAADNIQVEEKHGKTKKIKAKDDFEITNGSWSYKKKNKHSSKEEYQNFFVKTSILTSGGTTIENCTEPELTEEPVTTDLVKLSDEELFAACEGRTAHKGARHGLKALGKLARIEMQEQLLLKQSKYIGYSHSKKLEEKNNDVNSGNKSKNKKKKSLIGSNETNGKDENVEILSTEANECLVSGENDKNNAVLVENHNQKDYNIETHDERSIKKKTKKKKSVNEIIEDDCTYENVNDSGKKAKRKSISVENDKQKDGNTNFNAENCNKRKRKNHQDNQIEANDNVKNTEVVTTNKKKKKHKNHN